MNTKTSIWVRRLAGVTTLLMVFTSFVGQASARILFQDDTTGVFESENMIIGSNDAGANNTSVTFGANVTPADNAKINWNVGTNTLEVKAADGTATKVAITGDLSATGQVNFSNAAGFQMRTTADPSTTSCATVGELVYNTVNHLIYACTVTGTPGTWTSTTPSTADFEGVYGADGDHDLNTSNGAFTINTGSGALSFTSTNAAGVSINDSNAGPVNIGTGTGTGTVTIGGTGTQAIDVGDGAGAKTVGLGSSNTTSTTNLLSGSGGLNLNASNNQATNINTGTSTGAVNIGTGATAQAVHVGDGAGVKTVTVGSTNTTSATTITSGSTAGVLNVNNNNGTAVTNIGTGTTSGAVNVGTGAGNVTVGNSTGTVGITSNNWNVSTAGVASGLTGVTSTGAVNFSGSSAMRLRESANPNTSAACATLNEVIINTTSNSLMVCTTTGAAGSAVWTAPAPSVPTGGSNPGTCSVGQLFFNTGSSTLQVCTASNTWSTAGPQDFESVYAKDADHTLTTTNNPFTIAAGTSTVDVNGTGGVGLNNNANGTVNIASGTSTGAVNVGAGNSSGTVSIGTGTGAQTVSVGNGAGAKTVNLGSSNTTSATNILSGSGAVNVNLSNNQNTNINTGTSTGTVNIGNSAASVGIASSTWNISTAGAATGLTGVTSTGTVNFSGAGAFRMRESANPATSAACATVGELILDTTAKQVDICTVIGAAGSATWVGVGAGTLSGLTSGEFLRSDASSALTSGNTLTINSGATLSVAGTLTATNGGSISGNTVSLNDNSNNTTNINTGTSTGAVNIATGNTAGNVSVGTGTGAQTLHIGDGAGAKTVDVGSATSSSATNLLSGSGGLNLNTSNNQATNINTGTSTGAVNMGTGTGNVTIGNSTGTTAITGSVWSINTSGVASLAGVTSTGTVNLTGASHFEMPSAASNPGTCTKGDEMFNTTDSFVYVCTATNTWTKQTTGHVDEMNWEPEYPDTVIAKSGSNNNGTLVSDYDSSAKHQYYGWTTSRGTLQNIDLRFRYKLPADFTSTGDLTLRLKTLTTSATDNLIALTLTNATDSQVCSTTIDKNRSGTANTWDLATMTAANINTGCTGGTALAAGKIVEFDINLQAKNTGETDVGTVNLAYTN
jgi:hypothetical protein